MLKGYGKLRTYLNISFLLHKLLFMCTKAFETVGLFTATPPLPFPSWKPHFQHHFSRRSAAR